MSTLMGESYNDCDSYIIGICNEQEWGNLIDPSADDKIRFYEDASFIVDTIYQLLDFYNESSVAAVVIGRSDAFYRYGRLQRPAREIRDTELYKLFKNTRYHMISEPVASRPLINSIAESNMRRYSDISFWLPKSRVLITVAHHSSIEIKTRNAIVLRGFIKSLFERTDKYLYCNILTNQSNAEVCTFWLDASREPVDISINRYSPYINFAEADFNVLPDIDSFSEWIPYEIKKKLLNIQVINKEFDNGSVLLSQYQEDGLLYVLIKHKGFYYELYRISHDFTNVTKEKQFILT